MFESATGEEERTMSTGTLERRAQTVRIGSDGSIRPGPAPTRTLAASRLLGEARSSLAEAHVCADPADRFVAAHLAALRTAAAVLADRARPADPARRGRRPTSAWALLSRTAPELAEWSSYFAAGAGKRAAAQAGLRGAVTCRDADDLCRAASEFIAVAEAGLGMLPLDDCGADPTRGAAIAASEKPQRGPLR
jgi:hypothetical protein